MKVSFQPTILRFDSVDSSAKSTYALGRRVRVSLLNETFDGTSRGLESDGALRVETDNGQIRIVRAGEVTALRATNIE
jgi:biotin-(acetyl-CoA carboxylase) ligase